MIKALIFDFDGVIVDSEKLWLNAKINTLKKLHIKLPKVSDHKKFLGMNSTNFFKKLIDRKYLKKNRKKILFIYKKISKQYKKFYPKINYEIYKLIKSTKIEKFIVSNNSKNYIVKVLNHHNLKKFFKKKNIFCFKAPRLQKPSPYGYLKILSEFKFKPKEVIIIEDSESGIKAAKLAKLKNIFKFSKKSVNRLSEGVVNFKNSKTILNFINKK